MMEGEGGAAIIDLRARDGKRQSVFRSYISLHGSAQPDGSHSRAGHPVNLSRASEPPALRLPTTVRLIAFRRALEVVLSLGAIHTPKVLMQSGIGDQAELQRFGIPSSSIFPAWGKTFKTIHSFGCVWEYRKRFRRATTWARRPSSGRVDPSIDSPDLQTCQVEVPLQAPRMQRHLVCLTVVGLCSAGLVRPKSRGRDPL